MKLETILVPMDFGEPSLHALTWARGLAEKFGAALHVLHVVPNPYLPNVYLPMQPEVPLGYTLPEDFLDQLVHDAQARLEKAIPAADRPALHARTFVTTGDARAEILDHAKRERASLIVMGTQARRGLAHAFLGSVAEHVTRAAPCPVLTVR